MPFFEVFDFGATREKRRKAAESMTLSLCEAYRVSPEIVSVYFVDVSGDGYGHEGKFGESAPEKRIFVKLHAFRRSREMRREAARSVTQAIAQAYDATPESVVIYFFDREPEEVAHGGALACD